MDRRRAARAAGVLLALAACFAYSAAAPTSNDLTELNVYEGLEGCYYNFQHYSEGDRIMTNEPCLNCTCHNRMLMCYLRVCPFTKPIGQDCTIEKRADQCCPIVTCPDVPVDLLTSTSTSSPAEYSATGLGKVDKYGCSLNGKYFPEGSKVPPTPNKPCEHCYCIRNMTTCVMQECTLHVDGCTPIYHKDVCCPVRYSCDHPEDEIPLLDDMTTTVRPTPGFLLTTTTLAPVTQMTQDCVHDDKIFPDGALIKTEKACEHCYCMKGDIVCVVQECGTPMENEGKNCTALLPREGQCCPDTYICEGDEMPNEFTDITTEVSHESITPPQKLENVEGSGNEPDESSYTDILPVTYDMEGSGEKEISISSTEMSRTPIVTEEIPSTTKKESEFVSAFTNEQPLATEETTTEPDKSLNTVPHQPDQEKPAPQSTSFTDRSEVTEAGITKGTDIETIIPTSSYHMSSLPREEENIITTEKTFRKDDEGNLGMKMTTKKYFEGSTLSISSTESASASSEEQPRVTSKSPEAISEITSSISSSEPITDTSTEGLSGSLELITTPSRIPGEGDCLLNGITYSNNSEIPSENKCHTKCTCLSSIIRCEDIVCSEPPEFIDNCHSVYDSPDACCPTYVCPQKETEPPQAHNQMAGPDTAILKPTPNCDSTDCKTKEEVPQISDCASGNCAPCADGICKSESETHKPTQLESVSHECKDEECKKHLETPVECNHEACRRKDVLTDDKIPPQCLGSDCLENVPVTPESIGSTQSLETQGSPLKPVTKKFYPEISTTTEKQKYTGNYHEIAPEEYHTEYFDASPTESPDNIYYGSETTPKEYGKEKIPIISDNEKEIEMSATSLELPATPHVTSTTVTTESEKEFITKNPEVSVTSIEEQHATIPQESTTKASEELATATESQKPEVSVEPVTHASESPATASFEPVTSAEEITSKSPEEAATAAESQKTIAPEESITKGPEVSVTSTEEQHATIPQESTTKASEEPATATESQKPEISGEPATYASESPATASLEPVTSSEEITSKAPEKPATAAESQKTFAPEEAITKGPEVSVIPIEEQYATAPQETTTKAAEEPATATESQKPEVSEEPLTYASESPATASLEPVTSAEEITSKAPEEPATAAESQKTIAPEESSTKGPEVTVTSIEEQHATAPQESTSKASEEPATATESQKPEVSGEPVTYASESPTTASFEPVTSAEEITSKAPEVPATATESQKTIAPEEAITKGPEVEVVTQTESITISDVGELKTEKPMTKIESTTLATGLYSSSESILPQEEIHKEIQEPTTKSPEGIMTSVEQTDQITESHSTHEPTLPEEEFIPVTTSKPTTTKVEEEFTTKPSMDKFTRPEEKPIEAYATSSTPEPIEEIPTPEEESPPSAPHGYGQEPDYGEDEQPFGPGTCRYGGKVYVSAQQIPRDDPCDFCFCFRSDIICLQQSCPPPIHGCHEEPIQGFCCPRYECPVAMATTLNITTTTTTTTTTLPPHFLSHAYKGAAQKKGCQIKGHAYKVGEVVRSSSGPCLHCTCGGDGQMKCDPKVCTPEPMLRQMIAAAVSAKRRR